MPDTDDLGSPTIREEVIAEPRVIRPLTFYSPGDALAQTDFRPNVSRSNVGERVVEDGYGWRPPNSARTELRPEEAHDPHVSPLPKAPAERRAEQQETLPFPE